MGRGNKEVSLEDRTGRESSPVYPKDQSGERVVVLIWSPVNVHGKGDGYQEKRV